MKYIIIVLFIFSCTTKHENPQQSGMEGQADSIQYNETIPLFKVKALEDTLFHFMNLVDTIYNPYGAKKINFVFLDINKQDTIIDFTMHLGLFLFMDRRDTTFSKKTYLVGAYHVNGEDVVVYNLGLSSIKDIVNENVLSLEYAEDIDLKNDSTHISDNWDYVPSVWKYKLLGDSLVTIEKNTRIQPYQRRHIYFE